MRVLLFLLAAATFAAEIPVCTKDTCVKIDLVENCDEVQDTSIGAIAVGIRPEWVKSVVSKSANNFNVQEIVSIDSSMENSEVLNFKDLSWEDLDSWARTKNGQILIWVPKGVYGEASVSNKIFWYKFLLRAQSGYYHARFLVISQDSKLFDLGVSSIHVEPDTVSLRNMAYDMAADYLESGERVCNPLQKISVKVDEGQLYFYGVDR